jgi:hypothetical protein
MRRVDQPDHAVLDEVTDIDRMGHRGRDPASELLDKRQVGYDARILFVRTLTRAHLSDLRRPQ